MKLTRTVQWLSRMRSLDLMFTFAIVCLPLTYGCGDRTDPGSESTSSEERNIELTVGKEKSSVPPERSRASCLSRVAPVESPIELALDLDTPPETSMTYCAGHRGTCEMKCCPDNDACARWHRMRGCQDYDSCYCGDNHSTCCNYYPNQ